MNMGTSDRQFIIASTNAGMRMLSKNHSQTLKELLQKPTPLQNVNKTNCLSPNGQFKYVKRQTAKNCYQGVIPKSRISSAQERIRRPLNCFMVFSHLERKRVAEEHPELHNADLSKILGKRWKTLSPSEKQPYIEEAERIRQLHTEIYPDYKYQPRRKNSNKKSNKPESANDDKSDTTDIAVEDQSKDKCSEDEIENVQSIINENITTPAANSNKPQALFQMQNYLNQTPHASPTPSIDNNNMNSFPPTPEISPTLLEQQQPVFVFDNFQQFNQQQQHPNMESMQNIQPVQNQFDFPAMNWLAQQQNQPFPTSFYDNFGCQDTYYSNNNNIQNNNSNNNNNHDSSNNDYYQQFPNRQFITTYENQPINFN